MGAVSMRARAEMRSRWRGLIGVAVVIGLLGGGAIASAAGARRTMSSYPRFVERFAVHDVTLTFPDRSEGFAALRWVRARPEVLFASGSTGFAGAITVRGVRVSFPTVIPIVRMDAVPEPLSGSKVIEGRAFDPDEPFEVVLNYALADRLDLRVGDRVSVSLSSGFGLIDAGNLEEVGEAEIVGITAQVGAFESATTRGFPTTMMFTPAFYRTIAQGDFEIGIAVALRDGASGVNAFIQALNDAGFEQDETETPDAYTSGVQGLNRVPATALGLVSGLLLVLTLGMIGQAIARAAYLNSPAEGTFAALGITRAQRFWSSLVPSSVVIAAGAVLAMGVAFAASPLFPLGLARVAEPDLGFSLDLFAVPLGGLVLLLGLLIVTVGPTWRAVSLGRDVKGAGRSVLADRLAGSGAPPSAVTGMRFALARGTLDRQVPFRGAIVGSTIAIAALTASLVFVRSLDRLIADPTLSGYTWDAAVFAFEQPGELVGRALDAPGVARAWRGTSFAEVVVTREGAEPLHLSAIVSEGEPAPAIRGRPPSDIDEIGLDPRTIQALGLALGDDVVLADDDGDAVGYTLVGSLPVATLPFIGENAGQGATLSLDALRRVHPTARYEAVYATFQPTADFHATLSELEDRMRGRAFAVLSSAQATTVRNIGRLAAVPPALAGLMVVLGGATLTHVLLSSIRRKRRDLGVLKTIGFVARQVRSAVMWEAAVFVFGALALGIPLGIAAGSWGWRAFADYLTVVPVVDVEMSMPLAVGAGALVLTAVMAMFPARAAARTKPAIVLRSE